MQEKCIFSGRFSPVEKNHIEGLKLET
jgi:hypothetical protein